MNFKLHKYFSEIDSTTWNALVEQSIADTPFSRYEYLSEWWKTLGGGEWKVDGQKAFGMGGDNVCYHAFFLGTLDGRSIVTALVNSDGNVILPSLDALQLYISGQE